MAGCSGVSIPGDVRGGVGKAHFVGAEAARVNLNRQTFGEAQAREVAQRLGLPEDAWRSIPAPPGGQHGREPSWLPGRASWQGSVPLSADQGFHAGRIENAVEPGVQLGD